jgi:hypothetical protein
MICNKLWLCMTIVSCLVIQVHARQPMLVESNYLYWTGSPASDPLDPGFVGQTMDMAPELDLAFKPKRRNNKGI